MRKRIKIFTIISMLFLVIACLSSKMVFADDYAYVESSSIASYQEDEHLREEDLGYGIEFLKTTAITNTTVCSNQTAGNMVNSPQQVNVVSVPSSATIRMVNYTYPSPSGWSMQTLSTLVKQFEAYNPGWVVVAGVNGDFYDINSNDKALPGHTTGPTVSDGEVLRVTSSKSVGYTNNGTSDSFISTDSLTVTDKLILAIYDDNDEIIKTYTVDTVNALPGTNQISVYYNYRYNVYDSSGAVSGYEEVEVIAPSANSYLVEHPIRCLPASKSNFYGKGDITLTNTETALRFGQFAIVTTNPEVQAYLAEGVQVRVQKDVTGEMAAADQILGVGSTLLSRGRYSTDNSDGMRTQRHPRTCIGVKQDGSLVLCTVDGRQLPKNMYGMTEDELACMMKYYGCIEAFNVDGGGSTTFGIRNSAGNFVITNSPSDGGERRVSNAILVAVPSLVLNVDKVDEQSVQFSYGELAKGITVSNLQVTVGDITTLMDSNTLTVANLDHNTEYEYSYSYDITYKDSTSSNSSITKKFTTGTPRPTVDAFNFDISGNTLTLKYAISDPNQLISMKTINTSDDVKFPSGNSGSTTFSLSSLSNLLIELIVDYDVQANPNHNGKIQMNASWLPTEINLDNYYQEELEQVNAKLKTVNDALATSSIADVQNLINGVRNEIIAIRTKEGVEQYKNEQITALQDLIDSKKYKKANKELVNEILEDAKEELSKTTSTSRINEIVDQAEADILAVKAKGCNNGTVVVYSIMSCLVVVGVILKKKS